MNYVAPQAAAEFRIGPALRFSARSTWSNASLALQMSWPWLSILTALELMARIPPGYPVSLAVAAPAGADPVLIGLLLVLKLIATSSLAVNWTRFLLLGEVNTGWDRLRVDRPVWRLAWSAVLIWLACTGVFLLGGFVPFILLPLLADFTGYALPEFPRAVPPGGSWMDSPWTPIIAVSAVCGIMSGLPFVQRLSIKQAAISLGRDDYGLGDAWRDSAGQPFRIVLFSFAVAAGVLVVWTLALLVASQTAGAGPLGTLAGAVAAAAASGLTIILVTTSVAVLFGMLVEGREV